MKKFLKILGIFAGIVVIAIIGLLVWFNSSYPDVDPPSNETVEITPERIARGEYLANHVTVCMDCHSERDWTKFSGPPVPGTNGKGGEMFNKDLGGIPGTIYARNITPAALKDWTDGELMRTITNGINKNDEAIFPLMPYYSYNNLTKDDLYSLVAYIRSLKPIENDIPDRNLNFPMNIIVKTIPPKSYTPSEPITPSDTVAYGGYLVSIAGCADCHTPMDKGEPIMSLAFAGGFEFHMPGGVVRSSNITPDNETGIGSWTKKTFIQRFKAFDPDSNEIPSVSSPNEFNTVMPWTMYAGMSEQDLGAIYTYLKTIKSIPHQVTKFTPNK